MFAEGARVEAKDQFAMQSVVAAAREAQQRWSLLTVRERLVSVRRLRKEIASGAEALALAVPLDLPGSLHRSPADTLVAEVLPLLEACRFLEREAEFILASRVEGTTSRPVWLGGVSVETRRDPMGVVLVIGPGNYPLFLPGVQVLQALVAGNAVLWKPAPGGASAAYAFQRMLVACGLDQALVTVIGTEAGRATAAIRTGVDKVVLTGSARTGRAVLHEAAKMLTPAVMELSGCDAVFVLDGAVASKKDLDRVVGAVTFGLRLNGSATCMAPRRLFVTDTVANTLIAPLTASLGELARVPVTAQTRSLLSELIDEATLYGAKIVLNGLQPEGEARGVGATLLTGVTPEMRIAQTDIFAPVLSVLRVEDEEGAIAAHNAGSYGLTAAVFGPVKQAERLAARLQVGTVLINDMIVATADPRASFGGRKESGYGATRGREGLLAMTTAKTILRQSSRSRRAFATTGAAHIPFFAGLAQALHAGSWRLRLEGAKKLMRAARQVK